MDEWKKHIKAVLKDAMTNPAIVGSLDEYLNKRVELIVSFVPEAEKMKIAKTDQSEK